MDLYVLVSYRMYSFPVVCTRLLYDTHSYVLVSSCLYSSPVVFTLVCRFGLDHSDREVYSDHSESHSFKRPSGSLCFRDCYLKNNKIANFYSVISVFQFHSRIISCYFVENNSSGNGSILVSGASSNFNKTYFEQNIASEGGAIYIQLITQM